jgi:hypothetical protein
MISLQFDSNHLMIKDAAAILQMHSTQVAALFKSGKIKTYEDPTTGKHATTEADLIDYLSKEKLPHGFKAIPAKDIDALKMR